MSDLLINTILVARGYDRNNNNIISDNLKIRQDKKTLAALGGDATVTFSEFVNALAKETVIVKNGEVSFIPFQPKIPVLFQDLEKIHKITGNILTEKSDWQFPKIPLRPTKTDIGDDLRTIDNYNKALENYRQIIINDRATFISGLKLIGSKTNNKQIKNIALNSIKTSKFTDLDNLIVNKQNHKILLEEHNKILNTIMDIDHLTAFRQPFQTIKEANEKINQAHQILQDEKKLVDTKLKDAINNGNNQINKIENDWLSFKGLRIKWEKEKLSGIKKIDLNLPLDELSILAKRNYELSVKASEGFDLKIAKTMEIVTMQIVSKAEQIAVNAKDEIKAINGLLDK